MTKELRVTMAAGIGLFIEFYSFIIFILISPILTEVFFKNDNFEAILYVYLIFAAGYFVRPIGGWLLGAFGNKFGKKNTYLLASLIMALSTIFIGSLPVYESSGVHAPILLLVFRIFQGVAFGGEVPTSTSYIFEYLNEERRLFASTMMSIGLELGILFATIVSLVFIGFLSKEELIVWGWRTPFFIGAIISAYGLYLRYKLTDTPELDISEESEVLKMPVLLLFKSHFKEVFISFLLNFCMTVFFSIFCIFLPLLLHYLHGYKLVVVYGYNLFFITFFIVSTFFSGLLVNYLKVSPRLMFISAIVIIGIFTYPMFVIFKSGMFIFILCAYFLIALMLGTAMSTLPYISANLFLPEARYSGISISYNTAQCIGGGLTPILVVFIIKTNALFSARICIIACVILALAAFFMLVIRTHDNKRKMH